MATTFKRIVVPLDGTPFAETALTPACALARAWQVPIVIVRSVEPSGLPRVVHGRPSGAVQPRIPSNADDATEQIDDADAYLHDMLNRLRSAGLQASMVLYLAQRGVAIARTAQVSHADLIVMTAHPRWKADLLDNTSTTLQVLSQSRVSLLAWRTPTPAAGATGDASESVITDRALLPRAESPIVVPLDGSLPAEAALPVAERLAEIFGSYLLLTRAVQVPFPTNGIIDEARAYLARIETRVRQHGIGTTAIVRYGSPVGVIDTACREYDASMVVMASHAPETAGHRFLGSVAAHAIEDLAVPVFVVRAQDDTSGLLPVTDATAIASHSNA